MAADAFPDHRQLLAIGSEGRPFIHSGAQALGLWSSAMGADCASGGNLLAHERVPAAMVAAFETAGGSLGDRLIAALRGAIADTTPGLGGRERRTAPTYPSVLDAFASSGPAAPADRFLGLRHSG